MSILEEVRKILAGSTVAMTSRDVYNRSKQATKLVQISTALSSDFADGNLIRERGEGSLYFYRLKPASRFAAAEADKSDADARLASARAEVTAALAEGDALADGIKRYEDLPLALRSITQALAAVDTPLTLQEIGTATGLGRGELMFDIERLTHAGVITRSAPRGKFLYALTEKDRAPATAPVGDSDEWPGIWLQQAGAALVLAVDDLKCNDRFDALDQLHIARNLLDRAEARVRKDLYEHSQKNARTA